MIKLKNILKESGLNDLENKLGFDSGANRDPKTGNLLNKKLNFRSLEFEDVDLRDYPDFTDAYVSYAEYEDGTPLTDDELDKLDIHDDAIYDALMNKYR